MQVLSWNVYHGRAVPPAGRSLRPEFAAALSSWAWDVALLQEVPPWWAASLAGACRAEGRRALTSRNVLPPLQAWLAERWPDVLKSWGGGSNLILVRGGGVAEHRRHVVRWFPERRVVHAVRLASGVWVANLHASLGARAPGDFAVARRCAEAWAGPAPLVLGGDLNRRPPDLPGYRRAAAARIDAIYARGLAPADRGEVLDHGALSDHPPVRARLTPASAAAGRSPAT